MAIGIKQLTDQPVEDAHLLGHDHIVSSLKEHIEGAETKHTCISVNGEWGSGKTSIIRTVKKNLDSNKFDVLFFEAGMGEYADPVLGLISEIGSKYKKGILHRDKTKKAIRLAAYIMLKKFGIDSEKMIDIMSESKSSATQLTDLLNNIIKNRIGKKRLVIMIDDLDRCDPENALQVITLIRILSRIENCVCVVAIDLEWLKQMWGMKYMGDPNDIERAGKYLKKIFQLNLDVPTPTYGNIRRYIGSLPLNIDHSTAEIFASVVEKNPRSVKHTVNRIENRKCLLKSDFREYSAVFWTVLEEITSNKFVTLLHNSLLAREMSLGKLVKENCNQGESVIKDAIKDTLGGDHEKIYAQISEFFNAYKSISGLGEIRISDLDSDFRILNIATNSTVQKYGDPPDWGFP